MAVARAKGKPAGPRPPSTLSEQLRAILRARGLSNYEIGRRAGVDRANVARFLGGSAKLTGDSVDRLCHAFGLSLTEGRRRPAAVVTHEQETEAGPDPGPDDVPA